MKTSVGRFFKACGVLAFALLVSSCQGVALLDPQGPIGMQEKNLILISIALGFVVIIPVTVMTIWFALRYRESNTKATYKPHWEGSLKVEAFIWLIPLAIIVVLAILTVVYTKELDPYKPIASKEPPVRVQVISTDWNWLFIYPDYDIASINKLVIPAETPISFDLTSSTVMTSFFIPDLGSQMYVMAGMVTHLNLLADRPGNFTGHNMEFSGDGYASMHFPTIAMTKEQFADWTRTAKGAKDTLNLAQFNEIDKPQSNYPATTYALLDRDLFSQIVKRFHPPHTNMAGMEIADEHMEMSNNSMPDKDMAENITKHGTSTVPAMTTK